MRPSLFPLPCILVHANMYENIIILINQFFEHPYCQNIWRKRVLAIGRQSPFDIHLILIHVRDDGRR